MIQLSFRPLDIYSSSTFHPVGMPLSFLGQSTPAALTKIQEVLLGVPFSQLLVQLLAEMSVAKHFK